MPAALVAAGGGIGDIIRATPLIRVCQALGYDVDVCIVADYAESADLLDGAPEIRRLFVTTTPWSRDRAPRAQDLASTAYDVAIITMLATGIRSRIRAQRVIAYDRVHWQHEGDIASARRAAAAIGWTTALPAPVVRHSGRRFSLAEGTVALHAGCKPAWGFKRWHGFPELAARLERVVLVGSRDDLVAQRTYFRDAKPWPAHVQSLIGTLSLADTAALLSECSALVSNDSGLMHIGAALGIPTFGIFGLTSPARELMPLPNAHAVTKGLPCEAACRLRPWGRCDCEHHLQCLRTLQPDEVLEAIRETLSSRTRALGKTA